MKFVKTYLLYISVFIIESVYTSHFRGGTISWNPTGNGNEVQFSFKLGWAYGTGPGCTPSRIGQFVTGQSSENWICTSGCTSQVAIANINYICTGASTSENWEQGERTFTYTFPGIGPYTIEFSGGDWVSLDYGSPGSWTIGTVVYLAKRSDTQRPNSSPVTTGKPTYIVQYGCQTKIHIPVVDGDGDNVRCRWSRGSECSSICNALPAASIDRRTCTISFPASHTRNGTFAVAVSVEDFPKSTTTIGAKVYTPNTPMSTVNIQFLVKTPILPGNCNDKPHFVNPTLSEGSTIRTNILQILNIQFYATNSRRITKMDITSPAGMTHTPLQSMTSQPRIVYVSLSWTPQQNQVGPHIVCALAEDTLGKTSDSRCININVNDVSPCVSSPCKNGGTCARQGITQNYRCICLPGYTGHRCETDIDECASFPCQNNGSCIDDINLFRCSCVPGFTDTCCEIDINECASNPCLNLGTCNDLINHFTCSCRAGFTGNLCDIDINECAPGPCSLIFDCEDRVNDFYCRINKWKLSLIICSILLVNLLVISILIYLSKRRKFGKVDHSWLSSFIDVRKPDTQPRALHRWRKKNQRTEQAEEIDQNFSGQHNSTFFITPQTPIELSENRKKLLELNNKYWRANFKTRIVGEKLVFPNGSIHRDKVQKPKAEQILGMDLAGREALKKIKVTELETNEEENIFRGMGATTECYNQVRDMYKKTFCDQSYAKADHNILVYRFGRFKRTNSRGIQR
ncbi:integrin beta-like protein A [Saccostrea echinata]|uniref:integrin beta-like protein A n=1 Tax=Saccostrea echinata TaxID=191078 RepID=UPI002A80651A|nr:integrin beta-like protein A [Saccostrea echinata]